MKTINAFDAPDTITPIRRARLALLRAEERAALRCHVRYVSGDELHRRWVALDTSGNAPGGELFALGYRHYQIRGGTDLYILALRPAARSSNPIAVCAVAAAIKGVARSLAATDVRWRASAPAQHVALVRDGQLAIIEQSPRRRLVKLASVAEGSAASHAA